MSTEHVILPARQARAQQTVARILDSAEELLRTEGLAAFSVARVASSAGRGVGTVYERFADRSALLFAVFDRYLQRGAAENERILDELEASGASLAETCAKLASGLVRRYRKDARLLQALRALSAEAGAERLARHAATVARDGLLRSRAALLACGREFRRPDREGAAEIVLMMMAGAAELNGSVPPSRRSDEEIASALAEAAICYLAGPGPEAAGGT